VEVVLRGRAVGGGPGALPELADIAVEVVVAVGGNEVPHDGVIVEHVEQQVLPGQFPLR
jgi:hypothetical protein